MDYDISQLPDDCEQLKAMIISQAQAYAEVRRLNAELVKSNENLLKSNTDIQAKLDKAINELQRLTLLFEKFFNKSSQKLLRDQEQKKLEKEQLEQEKAAQAAGNTEPEKPKSARSAKGGGGRNPLPAGLPRVEKVIDHEVPKCDFCGQEFKCIGEERSEQLHFKPMELFVIVQILMKYVAACDCAEKRSETVESPIKADDKGVASHSLMAAIAVQKYMDHIPIARQSKQLFRRVGVHLPESSMCRWMAMAAVVCLKLYELMRKRMIEHALYIQMDATNVKYLNPDIKGKAALGTIWGYNGDDTVPYVLYDFQINGTRAGPAAFLKGYNKKVQCDANTVNHGLFVAEGTALPLVDAEEVGCWSHCRSNFYDARELQPASKEMLEMIGQLYGVERLAKRKKMTPEQRLVLRQEKSVPILDKIFQWCHDNKDTYDLPTDLLGKAIRYALNQEAVLRVYCTDGHLDIDNNAAERILRLIAIGRKNWQFYGSAEGGRTAAVLHSLLASAHRNGLNEYEYLLDVLDRMVDLSSLDDLESLLPDRWQPQSVR